MNVKEKFKFGFDASRAVSISLKVCAAVAAVCALILTFTVSDYYIFNRFGEFGFFFCVSQWIKKAGLLLILAAVFFNCRSCGDAVKYVLPLFLILSCCLFGGYFDVIPPATTPEQEVFNSVNLNFPKWLNITLFFLQNVAYAACCALLIVKDGVKVNPRSFICLPFALLCTLPLNIFENFFDINAISATSWLRFKNFTIWHFIALCVLAGSTIGLYYFLKNKSREQQDKYFAVIAITLLIQYHSKDSVVMGDGYNVYNTVFACLPLFICNIGVYIASASVIFKKRALYAMAFFVHAVGALTVFVYFGKDEMSNYGIFCSYSILYFCLTHCLLFALCVLPSALGHYRFKIKDCIIPLIYYFAVIVVASLSSTLVSSLSTTWHTADGVYPFAGENYMKPNYAFTQINPLPFEVPNLIPLGGAMQYLNIFYVLLVYVAYVCLFFAFYGAYRAFLAIRAVVLKRLAHRAAAGNLGGLEQGADGATALQAETAATESDGGEATATQETQAAATAADDGGEAAATQDEETNDA